MSGEPQPGGPDRLDRALQQLKFMWFGLFAGAVVITAMAIAIVFSNDAPMVNLEGFEYLFLVAVPFGLVGAYVVVPAVAPKDPAKVVGAASAAQAKGFEGWRETKPDDPFYWYPAFMATFFLRTVLLEGTAIFCTRIFLMTSNWIVLGGALVLLAAVATQAPTRAKVEAFAEAARARSANAG
jgi:hypothetical protein